MLLFTSVMKARRRGMMFALRRLTRFSLGLTAALAAIALNRPEPSALIANAAAQEANTGERVIVMKFASRPRTTTSTNGWDVMLPRLNKGRVVASKWSCVPKVSSVRFHAYCALRSEPTDRGSATAPI